MPIDRRQFLVATTTGALAVLTGAAGPVDLGGAHDAGALARPDLLAALGADAVRAIGRRYRGAVPAEDDVAALRAALRAAAAAERRRVAALVRDDFGAGRVVVVDGWALSATEARQCALFSLLHA